MIGQHVRILRHEDTPKAIHQEIWRQIRQGKTWCGDLKNRKKDGGHLWVQVYVSPIVDADGNITGYTQIRQDITDRKRAEELSITDELTSLFNRRHFNHRLPREMARASRDSRVLGLLILDVDYFKLYNDRYGHQQGDEVLRSVAAALRDELRRAGDIAFRVGGEEFAVVVSAESEDCILQVAERLRKAIEDRRLPHEDSRVAKHVTVSIGVKACLSHESCATDATLIYRLADEALYRAKGNGRNRFFHCAGDTRSIENGGSESNRVSGQAGK